MKQGKLGIFKKRRSSNPFRQFDQMIKETKQEAKQEEYKRKMRDE